MAAITIGTIRPTSSTIFNPATEQIREAIDAGETTYLNADGKLGLADNVDITLGEVKGIAVLGGAADEDYVLQAIGGDIEFSGATLTVGGEYVQGATAGTIVPKSDLLTGEIYSRIGYAQSTTVLTIDIANTQIVEP